MDNQSWNQKVYFESLRGNSKRFRTMHSRTKKLMIQHNEMNRLLELELKQRLFETKMALADIQRSKQKHLQRMNRVSLDINKIVELTQKRHAFITEWDKRHYNYSGRKLANSKAVTYGSTGRRNKDIVEQIGEYTTAYRMKTFV